MAEKITLYQRDRSRHQQKPATKPCFNCGAPKTESSHLIPWLELRKLGIPPRCCSEDWNLVPLCRPCHWLYDNQVDIFVGSKLKAFGLISSRKQEATETFFKKVNKKANIISAYSGEEIPMEPYFEDIYDLNFVYGDHRGTVVRSKIGDWLIQEDITTEDRIEGITALWVETLKEIRTPSTKEYKEYQKSLYDEFEKNRAELLDKLKSKIDEARKQSEELIQVYQQIIDVETGKLWAQDLEISGIDVTSIREGKVRIFLWRTTDKRSDEKQA